MNAETFVIESRKELKTYYLELEKFTQNQHLADILQKLSSYSARASFMKFQAISSSHPQVNKFLENELDTFLKEIEFQFRVWSRIQTIMQHEFEMSKGQA